MLDKQGFLFIFFFFAPEPFCYYTYKPYIVDKCSGGVALDHEGSAEAYAAPPLPWCTMCSVLVEVRERLFYRYYFRHRHVSWHPLCMLRSVLFLRRQCFIDGATYYVQSTRQHLPRAPTQPDRGRVRARKGKRNNGMRARAIAAGCSLWRTYPNSSLTLPFSSSFVAGYYCCRQAGGTCAASWSRGFSLASVFASACQMSRCQRLLRVAQGGRAHRTRM